MIVTVAEGAGIGVAHIPPKGPRKNNFPVFASHLRAIFGPVSIAKSST